MKKIHYHNFGTTNVKSPTIGGGNDGGDDLESRLAKVEARVESIDTTLSDVKLDIREMKKDISDIKVAIPAATNKLILVMIAVVGAFKYLPALS